MKQYAKRRWFKDVNHLNAYLDRMSKRRFRVVTVIPIGDRPTLGGGFNLLMIFRQED